MLLKKRIDVRVIFHGSPVGGPWSWLLTPGFRHCLMLVTIYFPKPGVFSIRHTMKVEPTFWGIDLDVIWRRPEDVAQDYLKEGATAVLKTTVDIPPEKLFAFRGAITCVSVIKAALVINDFRVITPFDLYRHLVVRRGAKQEKVICDGQSVREERANGPGQGNEAGPGATARKAGQARAGGTEAEPGASPADEPHTTPRPRNALFRPLRQ